MPDITFDVAPADGGVLVNGAAADSGDFIFALANGSTLQLSSAAITPLTVTDDEDLLTGDLDGDSPFPNTVNEQAPTGSNQTTDIGAGPQPLYVDFQYTVTAPNGETFTIFVIDVGNSPSDAPADNVAVTFLAFDTNNPPPFDVPLEITAFSQTISLDYSSVVCFCAGARILTDAGERAVETLRPGDGIVTRDHGVQPLRLRATRRLSPVELAFRPDLKPIVIRPGALGGGTPRRELRVSPQHRFVLSGARCELLFGTPEILAPAASLVDGRGIRVARGARRATYHHLLFDAHEVIFAEGASTESLHPGQNALDGMGAEARREVLTLFPNLLSAEPRRQTALPAARWREGRVAREILPRWRGAA